MQTLYRLADILHFGNHSLVVEDTGGTVHVFDSRGVANLYALLHSQPEEDVVYDHLVPGIINRAGTGLCPVETLCLPCATPSECLPLIRGFILRQQPAPPAEPALK